MLRKSGTLFLQWLVDAAVRIIDQHLAFARFNQKTLQVCRYDALVNFVEFERPLEQAAWQDCRHARQRAEE